MIIRLASFLIAVLCAFGLVVANAQPKPEGSAVEFPFTYLGSYVRFSPDGELVEEGYMGLVANLQVGVFKGSIILDDGTELPVTGFARLINGQGEGILKVRREGLPREKFPITFRNNDAYGGSLNNVDGTVTGFGLRALVYLPN